MEIFIVAIVTGVGIIGGMLVIWKGHQPTQVSKVRPNSSGTNGRTKKEHDA